MLIGQMLSKAGLKFMSAKGSHKMNGSFVIDEVVCESYEDAQAVEAWAKLEEIPCNVRVGTNEEIKKWKELQEMM